MARSRADSDNARPSRPVRLRVGVVCLQIPLTFVAGAAWGNDLDDPLVLAIVGALLGALALNLYGWAMSLAEWQYSAGRLDGAVETKRILGGERNV